MSKQEECALNNPDMLFCDGFDKALIGVIHRANGESVACYDLDTMVKILVDEDDMHTDEAMEYIAFNVINAYMGENSPVFLERVLS